MRFFLDMTFLPLLYSIPFLILPSVLAGDTTAWTALEQWALVVHNSWLFQPPCPHPSQHLIICEA